MSRPLGICFAALIAAAPGASGGELEDLLARMTGLDSMGLTASVQVQMINPIDMQQCCPLAVESGEIVEGSFSYMADGLMWRMDSSLDSAQYPGMNTTLIYDGTRFAQQDHSAGMLSIKTGPAPDVLGMMLLNPAFECIQFLLPLNDANQGTQAQLMDARAAAAAAVVAGTSWQPTVFEGKPLDRAVFPGATYDGVAYVHHVYAKPGEHDRPLVIDRVSATGEVVTRTRLSQYEAVVASGLGSWPWPRSVVWQAFEGPDAKLLAQITMSIDWITLNDAGSLAANAFDIEALPAVALVAVDGVAQP